MPTLAFDSLMNPVPGEQGPEMRREGVTRILSPREVVGNAGRFLDPNGDDPKRYAAIEAVVRDHGLLIALLSPTEPSSAFVEQVLRYDPEIPEALVTEYTCWFRQVLGTLGQCALGRVRVRVFLDEGPGPEDNQLTLWDHLEDE
jgi:hypothetical protein